MKEEQQMKRPPARGFTMPRPEDRPENHGIGLIDTTARRRYPANLGLKRRVEAAAERRDPGQELTRGLGSEDAEWARKVLGIEQ